MLVRLVSLKKFRVPQGVRVPQFENHWFRQCHFWNFIEKSLLYVFNKKFIFSKIHLRNIPLRLSVLCILIFLNKTTNVFTNFVNAYGCRLKVQLFNCDSITCTILRKTWDLRHVRDLFVCCCLRKMCFSFVRLWQCHVWFCLIKIFVFYYCFKVQKIYYQTRPSEITRDSQYHLGFILSLFYECYKPATLKMGTDYGRPLFFHVYYKTINLKCTIIA